MIFRTSTDSMFKDYIVVVLFLSCSFPPQGSIDDGAIVGLGITEQWRRAVKYVCLSPHLYLRKLNGHLSSALGTVCARMLSRILLRMCCHVSNVSAKCCGFFVRHFILQRNSPEDICD